MMFKIRVIANAIGLVFILWGIYAFVNLVSEIMLVAPLN